MVGLNVVTEFNYTIQLLFCMLTWGPLLSVGTE